MPSATEEAKKPRALQFADGTSSSVAGWACGTCGAAFGYSQSKAAFELAKLCCSKGRKVEAHKDVREEESRVEDAKKIPLSEYRGVWLFAEGVYFERETLADVQHDRQERNVEPLSYAWACEPEEADFDVTAAIEEYVGSHHDKGLSDEIDMGLLDAAQLLVDEALASVVSQRIRRDLVVLLPALDDAPAGDSP